MWKTAKDGVREAMGGGEIGVCRWYGGSKAIVRIWAFPWMTWGMMGGFGTEEGYDLTQV